MLVSTADVIPGKNYEVLGIARGNVVRAKHVGRDFMAGLKTIVGGEIKGYTELMNEARDIATERLQQNAREMGADAVVTVRYETCSIMQGSSEVMAYGTAVKFL